MKLSAHNRIKVRYTCTGPEFITQYNKDQNKEIRAKCYQEPKFEPRVSCVGCDYLETKTMKGKK